MKFWRRHRHELERTEADEPLPQPPEKKMRYSREDDILIATFLYNKPEGTSDKVFQSFARMVCEHSMILEICVCDGGLTVCSDHSIHIIHGKAGKSIIEFIRRR